MAILIENEWFGVLLNTPNKPVNCNTCRYCHIKRRFYSRHWNMKLKVTYFEDLGINSGNFIAINQNKIRFFPIFRVGLKERVWNLGGFYADKKATIGDQLLRQEESIGMIRPGCRLLGTQAGFTYPGVQGSGGCATAVNMRDTSSIRSTEDWPHVFSTAQVIQ